MASETFQEHFDYVKNKPLRVTGLRIDGNVRTRDWIIEREFEAVSCSTLSVEPCRRLSYAEIDSVTGCNWCDSRCNDTDWALLCTLAIRVLESKTLDELKDRLLEASSRLKDLDIFSISKRRFHEKRETGESRFDFQQMFASFRTVNDTRGRPFAFKEERERLFHIVLESCRCTVVLQQQIFRRSIKVNDVICTNLKPESNGGEGSVEATIKFRNLYGVADTYEIQVEKGSQQSSTYTVAAVQPRLGGVPTSNLLAICETCVLLRAQQAKGSTPGSDITPASRRHRCGGRGSRLQERDQPPEAQLLQGGLAGFLHPPPQREPRGLLRAGDAPDLPYATPRVQDGGEAPRAPTQIVLEGTPGKIKKPLTSTPPLGCVQDGGEAPRAPTQIVLE
eukprot:1183812-Prorocentrum_minimum.AAC.3